MPLRACITEREADHKSIEMALFLLLRSCDAYSLLSVPRASTRVTAPQMMAYDQVATFAATPVALMGDNTPARREMLNSAHAAEATRDSSPEVPMVYDQIATFAATPEALMGDNLPARRQQLNDNVSPQIAAASSNPKVEYSDFRDAATPKPMMGDNTVARRASLNRRSA